MENTDKKSDMKKTLIICGSAVLVAAIALVCVLTLGNGGNSSTNGDVLFEGEMTFEDFCLGMKKDLPEETMEEVKRLYEEAKKAMKDGDMEKVEKVYTELANLDVYDLSNTDNFQIIDGTASSDMEAETSGNWGD